MKLPIAVQLYSLRESMQNDAEGTLIALKNMGYDGVEFAGFYGKSAKELRDICDRIGLVPLSAHMVYSEMRDNIDARIEDFVTLGLKYVVISYMQLEFHKGGIDHEGVYENIKGISAKLRAKGIQLCYHNHNFELCETDGERVLDCLFDAMTDDELQSEIDTAWIELEVGEAEQYIRRFKNRCDLVHIKSYYTRDGFAELEHDPTCRKRRDTFEFCNFKKGVLDMPRIVNAAKESGAKWLVVEQDTKDPELTDLESAKINIDVLRALE